MFHKRRSIPDAGGTGQSPFSTDSGSVRTRKQRVVRMLIIKKRASMKKKPLFYRWILPLLALSAAILSGCTNLPTPLPTATSTPDVTATPVPPTFTPTPTLTPTATPLPEYLSIDPQMLSGVQISVRGRLGSNVKNTLNELIETFNTENEYGIQIILNPAYSDEELKAYLTGREADSAEIVIADSHFLRSVSAENDTFMPLNDFMVNADYLDSGGQIGENLPIMPVMLDIENQEGTYYALPLWTEPSFLFYNKTWAQELGFPDTPVNLTAFAQQACQAGTTNYADKDDAKHGTGGWIISSDPESAVSWLLAFADEGKNPAEILNDPADTAFSDMAVWMRDLYENGCVWTSRVQEPYDYFAKRYALFYSGTYADAALQFTAQDNAESLDNWDIIPYPRRSNGGSAAPRIYADAVSAALLKGDARSMYAGWLFLQWLYGDEPASALALAARGWPVVDNEAVTTAYRKSGEDKLYLSLSYRQYLIHGAADENRLTDERILADGFAYIFNPSVKTENIPDIWEQIGSTIAEINAMNHDAALTAAADVSAAGEENHEP